MSTAAAAAADPRFADTWADGRGRRSLLDLDPDLGALLDPPDLLAARHELTARVAVIGVGQWDLAQHADVDRLNAGLLIVAGVLAREVGLQDTVSTELLGPGEVAR